ncbi:MAG: hypothetical protein AAFZ17_16175 [Cyanobacteria bacterium J06650_10]
MGNQTDLRNIKTEARILRTVQGKVPLPLIIEIKAREVGAYQEKIKEKTRATELAKSHEHHDHSHSHDHHSHNHHGHDHHFL